MPASGSAQLSFNPPAGTNFTGATVVATATDGQGNTSEFTYQSTTLDWSGRGTAPVGAIPKTGYRTRNRRVAINWSSPPM